MATKAAMTAALAGVLVGPAWGAEPVIEEIVVTAQKRAQSIQDVSIAVTAFTGDELAQEGITDTRDLARLVPGFTYADSGFNSPIFSLRGVGFNEASQTASSTVGIYVDEVNLPFPVMAKGPNLDLERVEVLKGPQGTLYGRNTTGGAINYVARKPTEELEAGLQTSVGSYWTIDTEGFVSGPLFGGVRGRLAARTIHSTEGWQTSLTRPSDRLGKLDKQSARLGLEWAATEDLSLRFTFDGWREHSEPQAPQAVFLRAQNPILGDAALSQEVRDHPLVSPGTDDPRLADWPARPPKRRDFRFHDSFLNGALRADWDLVDFATFTFLASLGRFRSDGSVLPQSGLSVEYVTDRIIDVETDAGALEARLAGLWGNVNWLVGAFVSRDEVDELQDYFVDEVSAVFPFPAGTPVADRLELLGEQEADTRSAFGSVEWQALPAWRLTFGLRYTQEERRFTGCSKDSVNRQQGAGFGTVFNVVSLSQGGTGGADPNAGDCFTIDQETHNPDLARPDPLDEDNLAWRLAVDWQHLDRTLFYVSYSRGFKSGSFPVTSTSRSDQYDPVTQERLDAWELGAKNTLLDGTLQVNAALFHYDYEDKQLLSHIFDSTFGPLPVLRNAPESRVWGGELDVRSTPLAGLVLSGAVAYLNSEILEFTGINNDGDPEDYAGDPFNFAPEWSSTMGVDYSRLLTPELSLGAGADLGYTASTNSQLGEDPRFAHDDYWLANARVGLGSADERWSVDAWVRNLTNAYYVVGVFNPGDTIGRYTGMPRTFGVTMRYLF